MIIFVSGAYRGDIESNIAHAEKAAKMLWNMGWAVICPHLNSARFEDIPEDRFLFGYLEIIPKCDAIYMLNNYSGSLGARCELFEAYNEGLEILFEE